MAVSGHAPVTVYWRPLREDSAGDEHASREPFLRASLGEACFSRLAAAPSGKLYLRSTPDDPHPPHISLTHTRGLIACAVAELPVGLDAERLNRRIPAGLESRILSPMERAALSALPEAEKNAFLLTRWVMKEAHLKRTGEGLGASMARLTAMIDRHVADEPEGALSHARTAGGRVADEMGETLSYISADIVHGCLLALAVAEAYPQLHLEQC